MTATTDAKPFAEHQAALREQMMGPPTASQHLREAMRRESDPRWSLLPVEPVKAPRHTPIWLWMTAVSLSLGASAVIAFVV